MGVLLASMRCDMVDSPQKLGGMARSRSLSAQERSRIAREAAKKRWSEANVNAIAGSPDKPITLGGIKVPCYVLEDGRRVIATNGVLDALEMARGGAMVKGMNRLELFAAQNRLSPFVSKDLLARIADPIRFRVGNNTSHGFESDDLIDLAEAVIAADNAGVLQKQQRAIAHRCRVITSGLTRIGLIALIDEATGYQKRRDADELRAAPAGGRAPRPAGPRPSSFDARGKPAGFLCRRAGSQWHVLDGRRGVSAFRTSFIGF